MESSHGTLVAATVTTVVTTVRSKAYITVHHVPGGDTDPIYFTVDGSTPAVEGSGTFVAYPNDISSEISVQDPSDTQTIKLISAGAPNFSVEVLQ